MKYACSNAGGGVKMIDSWVNSGPYMSTRGTRNSSPFCVVFVGQDPGIPPREYESVRAQIVKDL